MKIKQKRQLSSTGRFIYETPVTIVSYLAEPQVMCASVSPTGLDAENVFIDQIDD